MTAIEPVGTPLEPVELDQTPLEMSLHELGTVQLEQVRRTERKALVNSLMEHHHYLRLSQPVGEHLKYLVSARGRPIACFCWSSAPRHLAPRDTYIGWSPEARRANLRYVAYQTRFLILPWIRVPHLASHLLGRMSQQLSADWEKLYAHPIYFTETFVDPERNRGTCYRTANWTALGTVWQGLHGEATTRSAEPEVYRRSGGHLDHAPLSCRCPASSTRAATSQPGRAATCRDSARCDPGTR
ncbi:MAG: DUF4338 domain-containing protein [Polyangiaceae bacterium]|nr:DUF4338 domain-containing protein [Polyangiaceae bacterium]